MRFLTVHLLIVFTIISTYFVIDAKPPQFTPIESAASCPAQCSGGPHDKCQSCGSACPLTCSTPTRQICTMNCIVNVCQCDEGYVRGPDNQCMIREECPQ